MKKKIDLLLIMTTILCLIPVVLSILLYAQLPNEIPVHFNNVGKADGYLPKAVVGFGLPFVFAVLNIWIHLYIDADPKKAGISNTIKKITKWTVPVASIMCIPMSLFISLEKNIPIHIIIPALVGVLIIVCGNYLPKSRQNYSVGIKLPWTLNNENNWNKTHRLAGAIWMVGGFVILISSLIQFYNVLIILLIILVMIVVPFVYSYILYNEEL